MPLATLRPEAHQGHPGAPAVDAGGAVTLKPAKPPSLGGMELGRLSAHAYPKKHTLASRRGQFSLLIVRGDGERVLRLNFPRRTAVVTAVALAVIVSVTGVLFGD